MKSSGERFVDELETRKHVVSKMNATGEKTFLIALPPGAAEWVLGWGSERFLSRLYTSSLSLSLSLSPSLSLSLIPNRRVQAHIHIYTGKELLHRVDGAQGVAEFVGNRLAGGEEQVLDILETIERTFRETSSGKGQYRSAPTDLPIDGDYHVGVVQPVLHYTMGGLKVDADARVLATDDTAMPGLFAAGEIMGEFRVTLVVRGGGRSDKRACIPLSSLRSSWSREEHVRG